MVRGGPIASVAIAGGGIVGWSAAAALKRCLPQLTVTVIPLPPPPNALADRMASTLPSIVDFHDDLGLTEADTVVRARSTFRLASRFEGWGELDYIHAYGDCGQTIGAAAFHHHWVRAAKSGGVAAFHLHSAAAAMADSGRFVHPHAADPVAGTFGYGLHIDPPRYRELMRAYALHLGAIERGATISNVRLRGENGFIEAVEIDGGEVAADLFVDATGPAALLRRHVDESREDWSGWLGCDRIQFGDAPGDIGDKPLDRVIAMPAGWQWQNRGSSGLVYSARHLSDSNRDELGLSGDPVTVRQGRLAEPWVRNCVAIGDSAVAVEPLEWTNLHLAHSAIDRLVAMMPDRDCSAVELWDYNRQANAEADRVRDFLILHYVVANRPEPFWNEAAELPESLAHTLTQFHERGRLPFYEEETFARDSWLSVLLGQGVIPRRFDPLVDLTPEEESARLMAEMRQRIGAYVSTLRSHSDYLRNLSLQAA
ncbi:MAG TPA: tryptophan halogenase family protein [Sphingomicrobium sp.]|nr:tryptophan halogenase family protein [Sphingomicrobium sp.]